MNYYIILGLIIFVYMSSWFFISLIKKRNDIADVAWGLGFVLIAWTSFFITGNYSIRSLLVNIFVMMIMLKLEYALRMENG